MAISIVITTLVHTLVDTAFFEMNDNAIGENFIVDEDYALYT